MQIVLFISMTSGVGIFEVVVPPVMHRIVVGTNELSGPRTTINTTISRALMLRCRVRVRMCWP